MCAGDENGASLGDGIPGAHPKSQHHRLAASRSIDGADLTTNVLLFIDNTCGRGGGALM